MIRYRHKGDMGLRSYESYVNVCVCVGMTTVLVFEICLHVEVLIDLQLRCNETQMRVP